MVANGKVTLKLTVGEYVTYYTGTWEVITMHSRHWRYKGKVPSGQWNLAKFLRLPTSPENLGSHWEIVEDATDEAVDIAAELFKEHLLRQVFSTNDISWGCFTRILAPETVHGVILDKVVYEVQHASDEVQTAVAKLLLEHTDWKLVVTTLNKYDTDDYFDYLREETVSYADFLKVLDEERARLVNS